MDGVILDIAAFPCYYPYLNTMIAFVYDFVFGEKHYFDAY